MNAPATPRIVVMMNPDGSLSPGMMNLAMIPATKPMIIVQMIPKCVSPYETMCSADAPQESNAQKREAFRVDAMNWRFGSGSKRQPQGKVARRGGAMKVSGRFLCRSVQGHIRQLV